MQEVDFRAAIRRMFMTSFPIAPRGAWALFLHIAHTRVKVSPAVRDCSPSRRLRAREHAKRSLGSNCLQLLLKGGSVLHLGLHSKQRSPFSLAFSVYVEKQPCVARMPCCLQQISSARVYGQG